MPSGRARRPAARRASSRASPTPSSRLLRRALPPVRARRSARGGRRRCYGGDGRELRPRVVLGARLPRRPARRAFVRGARGRRGRSASRAPCRSAPACGWPSSADLALAASRRRGARSRARAGRAAAARRRAPDTSGWPWAARTRSRSRARSRARRRASTGLHERLDEVDGHRQDDGRVWLGPDLEQRLQVAQLQRGGVARSSPRPRRRAARRPGTRPRR